MTTVQFSIDTSGAVAMAQMFNGLAAEDVPLALKQAADRISQRMKHLVEGTMSAWTEPRRVRAWVELSDQGYNGVVTVDDIVYYWINFGTQEHWIEAGRRGPLVYPTVYMPATTPGQLTSQAPRYAGPLKSRLAVWHTGVEPRRFDKEIIAIIRTEAPTIVREEIRRVLAAAGRRYGSTNA